MNHYPIFLVWKEVYCIRTNKRRESPFSEVIVKER